MSKKIVELKSKKKVEIKEMSIDEIDQCHDYTVLKYSDGQEQVFDDDFIFKVIS